MTEQRLINSLNGRFPSRHNNLLAETVHLQRIRRYVEFLGYITPNGLQSGTFERKISHPGITTRSP